MKNELDKLLFFNDLLGDLQELQHNTSEVKFNLSSLLLNIDKQQDNFLCYKTNNKGNLEIYFSDSFDKVIPNIHVFKYAQIDSYLLDFKREFSYLLELRKNYLKFCFYEDESIGISIQVKDQKFYIKTVELRSLLNNNFVLSLNISFAENKELFYQNDVFLVINLMKNGQLRHKMDNIISLENVLNDCRNVFFRLINSGIFDKESEYFTNVFKRNEIIPQQIESYEVLSFLSKNNFSCLSHLDFFDWGALLLGFSFKADFEAHKRRLKIEAIKKIKILKEREPWFIKSNDSI